MGVPDIAAAHFAAILKQAEATREAVDAAAEVTLGEDFDTLIEADEAVEALLRLILDAPETPKVMLALAAPAGVA